VSPEPPAPAAATTSAPASQGPLSGVRVLDLTAVVMGPLATQILGDLGADVVTVENRGGDTNRRMGPGPSPELSGVSLNLLRNKRNVALDLQHHEGRAALLRVAAGCDVFVTNLRPDSLRRLGLAYEDVAAVRPDVVYCQAHGFPSDGERANDPAFDDVIQAAGGVPDAVRRASGAPAMVPTLLADKVSGLVLTYAILAALLHRQRTGQGQRVEVPMVEAVRSFMLVEHGSAAIGRPPQGEAGYRRILTPLRRPLPTADGWVTVFPFQDAHWELLLRAAGRDDLVGDPRLTLEGRQADPAFGYTTLAEVLASRATAEWLDFCSRHQIPASEVADLEAMVEALPEAEHPVAGRYKTIPPPVRFSATPAAVRRHAPLVGEHGREALAEAGLSEEEISRLEEAGVLRAGPEAGPGRRSPPG
jgi:crotonobetainyl-CoA:carnitine CoA-transferase CaiB-like acyl-CoA transferase